MASPGTSRRDETLRGIDPAWLPLIDAELLERALETHGAAPLSPILETLRYGPPANTTVVLDVQDSTEASLAPETAFASEASESLAGPVHVNNWAVQGVTGDLRPWAVQGVLIFNPGLIGGTAWKFFIDDLLRRFCAERAEAGACVCFLLWGGDTRGYGGLARRYGHITLEPPRALGAEGRFEQVNCALQARGLRPVSWNCEADCVAFSDGSCPLNGKPGARASFAALITGAQFGSTVIRGEVCHTEYVFIDEDDPARGIRGTRRPAAPSNNRGELLGIIYAFLALLRGRAVGRAELVSDSKISVNTLLKWLPARLEKKTERALKNFDLVMIAWRLLGLLRKQAAAVTLTHMRSHQKPPPASAPCREQFLHRGNKTADEQAAQALPPEATYAIEVLSAPAILRTFAAAPGTAPSTFI